MPLTTETASPPLPLPPGPRGSWLLGSLPEFRRDIPAFYERLARQYGDVAGFRLGPRRLCLLSHPDLIEQFLTSPSKDLIKRTYVLNLLVPVLGNGLLTSEGDFWLRQRRLIQPAFHRQRLTAYGEEMVACTLRTLDRWRDGETRDLHAEMMALALEIAGRAFFGADVSGDAGKVGEALEAVMEHFLARWETLLPLPLWLPTPVNRRFKRALARLDAIVYQLIRQRRESGGGGDDVLSLLLRARDEGDGTGMTDRQVRDEVMTLLLAGHETTANALAWTWYLLATHPEQEARLLAEVNAVLGGRPPTPADVPRLPFCERVVLESLRLYPPAYGFGREAARDFALGGYRIPRGTTVIVSQWVVHRDGRFFDDPLTFRPDRWADGLAARLPRYAFFPFGGGPRVCIGNTFALLETALVLATIVPRFRFELVPGQTVVPKATVTLRPAQGIKVVLRRR